MDDHFGCLDHIKNPHIISSTWAKILDLIKRFLAKLETPIIPFEVFERIMDPSEASTEFLAA